ncbi:MAG: ABC transporter ATP-binding protein [Betaproteobacteria bacterium]
MLQVDQLRKRYDRTDAKAFAVQEVSFNVKPGEFFTLLGPSGCGKTTTLRSIAGLEMPDEGEIRIGEDTVFSSVRGIAVPVNRRNIAMVFQSYAIWPHMTVGQNVAFPLEATGVPTAEAARRIERALEMVGLAAFRDRPAPMLSGGQQQRVALARAFVKEARVLLLDEPLSNLDAKLREQMRVELRDLQRRVGTTAIYVTHDQEEAMSLSDRVAVMNDGRIVELAPPRALYLRPRTRFAAQFVGQADLLDCTRVGSEGNAWIVDTPLGRLRTADCSDAEAGASKTSLLIRPEHIELRASPENGLNEVAGVIERLVFSGRIVEYIIRAGDRLVRVQGTSREIFEAGRQVVMSLPPEHCVVVSD